MIKFNRLFTAIAILAATGCASEEGETAQPDRNAAPVADAAPQIITKEMYPAPAKQPNYGPAYGSLAFTDIDPGETIGGVMTLGRAIDENGLRIEEVAEGITKYMVHWGLEVGAPGVEDDKDAGDHGGDCRGFRDTGYVVMIDASDLGDGDTISWDIPEGTVVPDNAVYFVAHTLYADIHNLGKCTQTPIVNFIGN